MRAYLTEITVRSLKAERSQEKVWDTQTPGFGVRVNGSTKSWIVMYGEKRTLRTIGRYPAMSLADARKEAKRLLSSDLTPPKPTPTVEEAFNEYESTYGVEHHGERTAYHTRRFLDSYILPSHGHKRLSQLTFTLIDELLPLHSPSEANHLFRTLRAFLNWSVRKEYLTLNPLGNKEQPFKENQRDRVLEPDEIKALWNTATGQYGDMWKMLLLTGQRRAQVFSLERAWLKDDLVQFPPSVMKSKKPFIVPIGPMALEIINARTTGKHVFPSSKGGHTKNVSEQKIEHDKKAGVAPYVLHDLRRTFASLHASIGTPIHIVEKLLNHTSGTFSGVVGIYQRYSFLPEMRDAVQKYETHLKSLLSPEKGHTDDALKQDLLNRGGAYVADVEEEGRVPVTHSLSGYS